MAGEPIEPTGKQQEVKQQGKPTQPTQPSGQPSQLIPNVTGMEPRQAMQTLAGGESGGGEETKNRKSVPEKWLTSELQGNSLWPQMDQGILFFLGNTVVDSMSDGTTSWPEFQQLLLTDDQVDGMGKSLNGLHRKYKVPVQYYRTPPEGIRMSISPDNIKELWRREQYNVAALVFHFMKLAKGSEGSITPPTYTEITEGQPYQTSISDIPQSDLAELQAFFQDPANAQHIALLKTILKTATGTMWTASGKEDATFYRESVAYKTHAQLEESPSLVEFKNVLIGELRQNLVGGLRRELTASQFAPSALNIAEQTVNAAFGVGDIAQAENPQI